MKICGFNKTTLLDYPGRVACTIFLGGCNYRCPFCQNGGLVLSPGEQPEYTQEEILAFLKKRKGILDGVCVTGGEPTLSPGLPAFLREIRLLGYDIKLDTNGTAPDLVRSLYEQDLIRKVAVDIKAGPSNYAKLAGTEDPAVDAVRRTVKFLLEGDLDYEFRTTVAGGLHSERDFTEIRDWIAGAKAYYLQAFRDSDAVVRPGPYSCSEETMQTYLKIVKEKVPNAAIRGED